ncbi:DUF695 domain-containing protein [Angustibacter sp. McL0619]|uniref:DUF695 domain-containing protein n=1 Tax=Angustibacter sp. McL0619 TaxID=3415676 RepID=UPI003CFB3277
MSFLRRKPPRASPDGAAGQRVAIEAFWSWWVTKGSAQTALAIEGRDPERMVSALSERVDAIDSGLAWELGPGSDSSHVLVVTGEGNPDLRPLARRWRMAAPVADLTWSYSDVRLPAPDVQDVVLRMGEVDLDAGAANADVRVVGAQIDVVVHHPRYPELPEDAQRTATFLLLDAVLGESDVETWIGQIGSSEVPALDPIPLVALRAVVEDVRAQHTGPDGEPHWVMLNGTTPDGGAILASTQVPLRASTAPHLDTYVPVVVPFADRTEQGLPGPGSLSALRDLEDHLTLLLGDSGRIVAHQSHDGVRILHVYVDGTTPAAEQVRAGVVGWDQGAVKVDVQLDPGWSSVRHLRP